MCTIFCAPARPLTHYAPHRTRNVREKPPCTPKTRFEGPQICTTKRSRQPRCWNEAVTPPQWKRVSLHARIASDCLECGFCIRRYHPVADPLIYFAWVRERRPARKRLTTAVSLAWLRVLTFRPSAHLARRSLPACYNILGRSEYQLRGKEAAASTAASHPLERMGFCDAQVGALWRNQTPSCSTKKSCGKVELRATAHCFTLYITRLGIVANHDDKTWLRTWRMWSMKFSPSPAKRTSSRIPWPSRSALLLRLIRELWRSATGHMHWKGRIFAPRSRKQETIVNMQHHDTKSSKCGSNRGCITLPISPPRARCHPQPTPCHSTPHVRSARHCHATQHAQPLHASPTYHASHELIQWRCKKERESQTQPDVRRRHVSVPLVPPTRPSLMAVTPVTYALLQMRRRVGQISSTIAIRIQLQPLTPSVSHPARTLLQRNATMCCVTWPTQFYVQPARD